MFSYSVQYVVCVPAALLWAEFGTCPMVYGLPEKLRDPEKVHFLFVCSG